MSQDDVATVRRLVEAFNARDREAILRLVDPEIEFTRPPSRRRIGESPGSLSTERT
jgi:hypothetical protein